MIRYGREQGGVLFHNLYSDPQKPDVLVQPFYTLLGIVTRLIFSSQFTTYFFTRDIAAFVFILSIIWFICKTFNGKFERLLALGLSLSATSIWSINGCGNSFCIQVLETYTLAHLSSFYRLLLLPPHHYLALALLMVQIVLISTIRHRASWLAAYSLSSILLAILHPYIAMIWLFIFSLYIVVTWVTESKNINKYIPILLLSCGLIVPWLYLTNQSAISIGGVSDPILFSNFPVTLPLINFIEGLGYIVVPFLLSLVCYRVWRHNKYLRFCMVWAFIPFIAYKIPILNQILGYHRVFQIMPQIPAAIFSVVILFTMIHRYNRMGSIITSAVLVFFVGYHLLFVYKVSPLIISANSIEALDNQRIQKIIPALHSLTQSQSDVIVAGNSTAPYMPALINIHVINGHEGNTDHFEQKIAAVQAFYSGSYSEEQVKEFIHTYHVTYFMFGIDTPTFSSLPYSSMKFLKQTYSKDGISIVKIL